MRKRRTGDLSFPGFAVVESPWQEVFVADVQGAVVREEDVAVPYHRREDAAPESG